MGFGARDRVALAMVGLALISMAVLVALTGAHRTSIEHDEAITFLSAAGQQGTYAATVESSSPPVAMWAPASSWQGYLSPVRPFALGTIRSDLANHDIHPPAYFWLLHVWALVFGLSSASAIALNVLLAVGTGAALYVLAGRVLRNAMRAASVVAFWAVATPVVGVSVISRQYGLLALVSVLTVLCAHVIITKDRPTIRDAVLFALVVGIGAATHYHYALVLSGVVLWVVATSFKRPTTLLVVAGGIAGGALLFYLLHPEFLTSFATQKAQAQTLTRDGLITRIAQTITTLNSGFFSPRVAEVLLAFFTGTRDRVMAVGAVLVVILGGLGWALVGNRRAEKDPSRSDSSAMIMLGVWITGLIGFLYLTGRSPQHAMGARYLAAAWPFLAFLPAVLLRRIDARVATAIVAVWAVAAFVPIQVERLSTPNSTLTMAESLRGAHRIVIDGTARGVVPRILIDAEPGLQVFAAKQSALLENPELWIDSLAPNDLIVSDPWYAQDQRNKARIEALLRQEFVIEKFDGPAPFTWWRIVRRLDTSAAGGGL